MAASCAKRYHSFWHLTLALRSFRNCSSFHLTTFFSGLYPAHFPFCKQLYFYCVLFYFNEVLLIFLAVRKSISISSCPLEGPDLLWCSDIFGALPACFCSWIKNQVLPVRETPLPFLFRHLAGAVFYVNSSSVISAFQLQTELKSSCV